MLRLSGSILDIKERSNKDGKKYAFLTVSTLASQIELSIFSDKLSEYRHLIKEGNILLFNIDISRDNENLRMIIRKIDDFDKKFQNEKKIINIYLNSKIEMDLIDEIFEKSNKNKNYNDEIYLYVNKNDKLLSLNFSKNYKIHSYKYLDQLSSARKIDYSIDFS